MDKKSSQKKSKKCCSNLFLKLKTKQKKPHDSNPKSELRSDSINENVVTGLILMKNWIFLEAVIQKYPVMAREPISINENQKLVLKLPLHEVCKRHPTLDIVKSLINAYPESTRIKDSKERLPLHILCSSGVSKDVILFLVKKYPYACLIEDKQGALPLALAKKASYKHEEKTLKLLMDTQKMMSDKDSSQKLVQCTNRRRSLTRCLYDSFRKINSFKSL